MSKARKTTNLAIIGATGLVGQEILKVLEQRGFPIQKLLVMASEDSMGDYISFQGQQIPIEAVSIKRLQQEKIDIVLMSAGSQLSKEIVPEIASLGILTIDNSEQWRMHPDVPLVVPEVNAQDIVLAKEGHIIANPNCTTIQMVVALWPLHQRFQLKRLIASTYQAVSGQGKKGMEELGQQVSQLFSQQEIVSHVFPKRIAFNLIPQIGTILEDGSSQEERKMREESQKILHIPGLGAMVTCVRVAVFNSHAISLTAEFHQTFELADAEKILSQAPGVLFESNSQQYHSPVDVDGSDATYVSRLRRDISAVGGKGLSMWIVADNIRKGAATNAVQIAEIWLQQAK